MSIEETLRLVVREEIERATHDLSDRLTSLERRLGSSAPGEAYITPARAAEIAGVSPGTIRDWVHAGRLKRYGTGRMRIKAAELQSALESKPAELTHAQIEERAIEAARKLGAR